MLTLAIAAAITFAPTCTTDADCAAQDVATAAHYGVTLDYISDDPLSTPVAEITPAGLLRLSCYAQGDTLYFNGRALTCAPLPTA